MNRRTRIVRDEAAIVAKFGVLPTSIPDYLALVGDAADGYPGLRGWGRKSAAAVLARYEHLENIPEDWRTWGANAANPAALSLTLTRDRDYAFLFRNLATLRTELPLFESVEELRWNGPRPEFAALAARFDAAVTEATSLP
jgi:5'-3' exonuclease